MSRGNGASGEGLLARLAAISDELPAEIAELERQREEIDTDLRRLKALQRTLNPETQAAPKQKPRTAKSRVSEETLRRVLAVLEKQTGTFSAQDIGEASGISEPTVYATLRYLREREAIGKAGEAPRVGSAPRGKGLFRVLDLEAAGAA